MTQPVPAPLPPNAPHRVAPAPRQAHRALRLIGLAVTVAGLTACAGNADLSEPQEDAGSSSGDGGIHVVPRPPIVSAILSPLQAARFEETSGGLTVGTVTEAYEEPYRLDHEGVIFEFRGYRIVVTDARGDEMVLIGMLANECAHVESGGVTTTLCPGGRFMVETVPVVGEVIAFKYLPQGGFYQGVNTIMVHAILSSDLSVAELEATLRSEFLE